MTRWIVCTGLFAAAFLTAARVAEPTPAAAACSSTTERRLLPNGRFENVTRQDCYPDLHSAPMSNSPPSLAGPAGNRCRNVQERVLQPNGQFRTRSVERCN